MDFRQSGAKDVFYAGIVSPDLSAGYGWIDIPEFSLNWSYYTDEKRSGSFTAIDFPDIGNNLLRLYCDRTLNGETVQIPFGTYFLRRGDASFNGAMKARDVKLHSTVWRHINDFNYADYVIPAWSDAMTYLTAIVNSGYGQIHYENVTDQQLSNAAIFKAGESRLKIINYCCDYLGCGSVDVLDDGRLVARPYLNPENRPIVWTFEDGQNCQYVSEMTISSNEDDIPTAVYVNASCDGQTKSAIRRLPDSSPYSAAQRKRNNVAYYSHNDLTVSTTLQAAAEAKADEYYSRMLTLAVSVEIEHFYAPIHPGDAVRFVRGETDITAIVSAMEIKSTQGIRTRTVLNVIGGALGDFAG